MKFDYPALLVDKEKVINNVKRMKQKASNLKKDLRPHFKTHQSVEIGDWIRELGVNKIAVSSPQMAEYFARYGWKDILIAFPVNLREMKLINDLGSRIRLGICISDIKVLDQLMEEAKSEIDVWIETDINYYRSGIDYKNKDQAIEVIKRVNEHRYLNFKGLMIHKGDLYINDVDQQEKKHIEAIKIIKELKSILRQYSEDIKVSYGDTPSCSSFDYFEEVDELRPGNFVFYDLMQHTYEACKLNDIAICLSSPVVAVYEDSRRVISYGGAVHLAKDYLPGDEDCYGKVVKINDSNWDVDIVGNVYKLSQEHGVIRWAEEHDLPSPGDVIGILPVHSCHTASAMGCYYEFNGGRIERFNVSDLGHYYN
ncbi:alanine racemase [Mangrovivirga sp. M17]|uniref:Alanine racemase n=1 Tax=Mangrovivirga halotolerans TaxID=2993936 RepID=A0ABT3RRJ5_9BACT|nr:alanine racemase [Mangrovivirga halotolerans]MCX2743994.1 alanine racemase [Mangrovivirga halotolerans]